ncbi:urokinase plasminogen activator surface receptor-like [Dendropsophus ebraccatus]|uniref:urokinase plasminogen activator surface receptor-like n=1 Tax=Dendropsophus ebraccatus TaxID=150705 RepID=UPI003831C78F
MVEFGGHPGSPSHRCSRAEFIKYRVSPKIRQCLILIFTQKQALRLIFGSTQNHLDSVAPLAMLSSIWCYAIYAYPINSYRRYATYMTQETQLFSAPDRIQQVEMVKKPSLSFVVLCLKCLQCVGTSSSCRMVAKTCSSYETTCISLAYRSLGETYYSNTLMKGCATTELCNQTSIIDTGKRAVYMSATCCETNYCNLNRYSTSPVFSNRLQCNSCKSSTLSCSSPFQSLFCDEVNNNCVDVVTKEYTNGALTASKYVKGCGQGNVACTDLFAYDTKNYQSYTYLSCCSSGNNCNSFQVSIPILNNINGIRCFACLETGNNECAVEKQVPVDCKGTLIRCMEAFDQNRKTIMKGCSTVGFCSSTFPSQDVPKFSEIQCCAGNMCNNFTQSTSNTTTMVSNSTRLNTDLRLPAFLITLIYVILRHYP